MSVDEYSNQTLPGESEKDGVFFIQRIVQGSVKKPPNSSHDRRDNFYDGSKSFSTVPW